MVCRPGPRSNDNLLQWYGFVAADNPDDDYVLDNLIQRLRALQVLNPAYQLAICWQTRVLSHLPWHIFVSVFMLLSMLFVPKPRWRQAGRLACGCQQPLRCGRMSS